MLSIISGADPNVTDTNKNTPLSIALRAGHKEIVESILQHAPSLLCMQAACTIGHVDVVKFLIERGLPVDTDIKTREMTLTPLHVACENGNKEVVEYLLSKGANPQRTTGESRLTALHCLTKSSNVNHLHEIAEMLVQHGIDVNATNKEGNTAFIEALKRGGTFALIETLLTHGADISTVPYNSYNYKELEVLFKHGWKVPYLAISLRSMMPGTYVQARENSALVVRLIQSGFVDLDSLDEYGNAAIHYAFLVGLFLGKLLLECGAKVCTKRMWKKKS